MKKISPQKLLTSSPKTQIDRIALWMCFLTFLAWMGLLTVKYCSFGYYDWDLALYAQAMFNLTHGSSYSSLFGMSFLSNHAEYIAFLLVPIYAIFPHPMTLIYLKILSFSVGTFLFYLTAKRDLPAGTALILSAMFVIYPANIYGLLYEFHFESLNVAFLFLLYYFYQNKKFAPFFITLAITSLIKENMPLIIVAFGIYALFSKKRDIIRWGILPILWGCSVFLISMFIITPALRTQDGLQSANQYIGLYSALGNSPLEIVKNSLFHPQTLLGTLFNGNNIYFLFDLLAPLLFFPLFRPDILFLGSPVFLQHLLSCVPLEKTILYHYALTLTPFLFLAMAKIFQFIRKKSEILMYVLLSCFVLTGILNLSRYRNDISRRVSRIQDHMDPIRWQMVKKIPPNAGVISTLSFLADLSQRDHVYSFLNILKSQDGLSGKTFSLPPSVSYALIDFSDGWIKDELLSPSLDHTKNVKKRILEFLNEGWMIQDVVEDIVLLKRTDIHTDRLVEQSPAPFFDSAYEQKIIIDDSFLFLKHTLNGNQFGRSNALPFTFYWKATRDIKNNYLMVITCKKNNKTFSSVVRQIGYTISPTSSWKQGDYIREHYWLMLNALPSGEYSLELNFYNMKNYTVAAISNDNNPDDKQPNNTLKIGKIQIP